ncbi:hypothetical protein, partial [Streptomyces wuyuanensis]|uniref:hypothetical protein n=1 Tax=Streptomyces wuyuanensis TaxID=1196353 RepID=UPI003415B837
MSDPTKCSRPDCEGVYEDVGGGELYCDTCGLAPEAGRGGTPPTGSGERSGAAAGACRRPGCEGAYEDVGEGELYCDTCGLAPEAGRGG